MCLVSVAVITYNMEKYLRPLLDSILSQKTDFEYEIVICDDCSPDGSSAVIDEYRDRYPGIIRHIVREKNVGGSRNMYGVMRECRGKYIAILEGDDFWDDENKLSYQVSFLESHPEYIGMTCNSYCEHGEIPTSDTLMRNRTEPKVFTIDDFTSSRYFRDRLPSSTDTWVFRNIFKEYPDEDFSLFYDAHPMIWDQPLILILYGKGKVYADPKVVSHHRSVTKKDGTNYQSLIKQKNVLYGDSCMYKIMEEYISSVLHKRIGKFRYQRGDTWIDAMFRAMLTKKDEDREIEKKIRKDQKNKIMLTGMFIAKSCNIILRKMHLIK
ncbi:MAG: glycosyltransferase [Firmicutes bacterium]|nr:glycosyltransferase [Candidatus Colimorpha enterica]